MTQAESLAAFATAAQPAMLSAEALGTLKVRVLDSLGCAIGALEAEPVGMLRRHLDDVGGAPRSTLVGGGATSPDRAALYNGALVRYLDFNDGYLAPRETCHPSDNLAPVLAAAEYAGADGAALLAALAVAYQVQCRLSDEAPVRDRGFDHTTQGVVAVAAGASRALGLDARRAAHAVAIAGTAFNALRVTRTGSLSHWKGLAYPNAALAGVHAALLAARGITGPIQVFEGAKGFMEVLAGPFQVDWAREDLERVTRTVTKRFDAEIHAQAAIEGLLELRAEHEGGAPRVDAIELRIFDVAYDIIGGGAEGDKKRVSRKEEADHSLPYLLAVAWLDGEVQPRQFEPARIARNDVQQLLRRVHVRPDPELSRRFPAEHACRLRVRLADGRVLEREKRDYAGFLTRPAGWDDTRRKFDDLARAATTPDERDAIAGTVAELERHSAAELGRLLAGVGRS